MTEFYVFAAVTCTAVTVVEAETEEKALSIAKDRSVHLGFPGCGVDSADVWIIEEADGEPEGVHIE